MTRRRKDILRELTDEERRRLEQVGRSRSEPASHVARARALLAVANGQSYVAAAQAAGWKCADVVSHLVNRFNQEGLAALEPKHGGGPALIYDEVAAARILKEAERTPDREKDGTATWSLTTLQHSLRQAPDGFSQVSTYTISQVLHRSNWSWQKSRTWCQTGQVQRQRKEGIVEVTDPDATPKKT